MITYSSSIEEISCSRLKGFFVGWPDPPDSETHLKVLQGSSHVVLAIDSTTNQVVGFVSAISDGVLFAFVSLLEVLPAYQGQGIGQELMRRMLEQLKDKYAIDLVCDKELSPFYQKFEMFPTVSMSQRNYRNQSGKVEKNID